MSQAQEPLRETAGKSGKKNTQRSKAANTASPTGTGKTPAKTAARTASRAPARTKTPDFPVPPGDPALAEVEEKGDLVTELVLRFGRFGWDVLGVGLIAFALVTLVGFLSAGQPQGILLGWWVSLVSRGTGWGWPLLVVGIALLGLVFLRRRFHSAAPFPLGRILALEGMAFALLTLLAIFGGLSLEQAEAGMDGGVIGWALAVMLNDWIPVPWSTILLTGLILVFALYGTGVFHWALHHLEQWVLTAPLEDGSNPALAAAAGEPASTAAEDADPVLPAAPAGRDPRLPPMTLLLDEQNIRPEERYIQETARKIEETLEEFGLPAHVVGYRVGPTVTQYALEPGFVEKPGPDGEPVRQKVRVSQISALSRDLALALSAERLRIEAPVPGRSYMGIEVPNSVNAVVRIRPLMESSSFQKLTSPLALVLGKDVSGQPVVADLARMPHLLIAGTTGSGKSVCIASIATCLVVNNHPDNLRLAMLDPKMVELARFNGLPHLLGKVETELERMLGVLRWALVEMDNRYKLLEQARARDIEIYNQKAIRKGQPTLPRIVIIVDEMADLMMSAPDQTEHSLIRLAQMARATGIHLIVATQRPSTDVVTGLIKANFPARIAFAVASSIDSRVILDTNGAEALLGKGDMLFLNPESGTPLRSQGVLVSEEELERVLSYWKNQAAAVPSQSGAEAAPWEELLQAGEEDGDNLVEQAVKIVRSTQRASTSLLQRRLRVGYPRAARLMDELEELGVVGPSQGGGREREVLLPPEDGDEADREDSPPGP